MTQPDDEFDFDHEEYDRLQDFESRDWWRPTRAASTDYLDGMWGRSGFRQKGIPSQDVLTAHGMVQSFINAFSRDGRYVVTFDPKMKTAGTDMKDRRVVITPAPILDANIDAAEAGRILTALAVHEICHPRYGKDTSRAVERTFPKSRSAAQVSNMLDDIRIESRYIDDYPGYAGVFEPARKYVARTGRPDAESYRPTSGLNTMISAVRYPDFTDWSGLEAERDWWQAWRDRWSREDSPRRHVDAVREALRHLASQATKPQPTTDQPGDQQTDAPDGSADDQESPSPGAPGAGRADQPDEDGSTDEAGQEPQGASQDASPEDEPLDADSAGQSDEASRDVGEAEDEQLEDEDLGQAADLAGTDTDLPTCTGTSAVEQAAQNAGVDGWDIENSRKEAQTAVENAEYTEDDGHGQSVDVSRSMRGLVRGPTRNRRSHLFRKSDAAARYVREAFLRSRTGHTAVARYQKRGRLDDSALHRVASRDFRLFDRKHAPSPGKFLVWILLDNSSSMSGSPSMQSAQVATAVADATQYFDNVRAEVWAWTTGLRPGAEYYEAAAARAWQTGQPTSEIAKVVDLHMSSTPDSVILGWAQRAIRRETRRGEQPVLLLCSDGWGNANLGERIEEARRAGVWVASMALGGQVDREAQEERFGPGWYVEWQGTIIATARPLAQMIARIVGRDRR